MPKTRQKISKTTQIRELNEKCPSQINKLILMGFSCDSKFNVGELKQNQRKCRTFKREHEKSTLIKMKQQQQQQRHQAHDGDLIIYGVFVWYLSIAALLMIADWKADRKSSHRSHARHTIRFNHSSQ